MMPGLANVLHVTEELTLRDCVRNAAVDVLTGMGMQFQIDISRVAIRIADEFEKQLDEGPGNE